MLKKIAPILFICLAISSLFLSFQEYKSMWADFDSSGMPNSNFGGDDSFTRNKDFVGYELITPIFPVILLTLGNYFLGFTKMKSGKIVSIILISLSVLFLLFLYRSLGSPAEARPNSISRPPVPIIGIGYYILLATSIVSLVYSLVKSLTVVKNDGAN